VLRSLAPLLAAALVGCNGTAAQRTESAVAAASSAPSALPVTAVVASAAPAPAPAATPQAREPEPPRVYAKSRFVWIRPEPTAQKDWIGFLWSGGSVRLKSTTPIAGPGCSAFYAVEPQGYVCADGKRATLDATDPVYRALSRFALKADSPYPHRYGESLGLPRYLSTPTPELQGQREAELRLHLANIAAARAGNVPAHLTKVDFSLPAEGPFELPALPGTVFENRKLLKPRSTVAYSAEARFGERGFLLTADYAWVPKDRVVPYPAIAFRGLALDAETRLPLALFRKKDRPRYARAEDGSFHATEATFERLGHVALSGTEARADGERYLETREPGIWVRERDAVVPRPRAMTPWGATVGAEDTTGRAPKGRGTWLEIAIDKGWLLAFEGTRPVYATLMSPGRGGAAAPDEDPLERSATPVGVYPISGKFVTATMEAPGELIHSDVPFAQNVVGPYALHGAYWHDNWGNPQSGGCVNLSPIDAKWLFDFTEPRVPEGWHGVRWLPWQGAATIVILHR